MIMKDSTHKNKNDLWKKSDNSIRRIYLMNQNSGRCHSRDSIYLYDQNLQIWKLSMSKMMTGHFYLTVSGESDKKCDIYFNKPLRCQHWQMHRYVKILLIVECLQSVQYDVYSFAKLSHYIDKYMKKYH